MKKKRKPLKWAFITLLWITVLFSCAGILIEALFTLGFIQTDLVPLRQLSIISTVITLVFIISANIVWWNILKEKKKQALLWWHILMGISILNVIYKYFEPTALRILLPNYFITMPMVLIAIWATGFAYLRKMKSKTVTSQTSH